METPSADDARGGSLPGVTSTSAQVPRPRRRARPALSPAPPSPLAEINRRLAGLEQMCFQAGLATVGPRNRILLLLVEKLDHMHADLVALREWARVPRPECYPDAPPEPRPRSGA